MLSISDLNLNLKIKDLAKKKGISIRKLCSEIDITENGLSNTLKNNTLKIDTLLKISSVLDVPVTFFFSDNENIPTGKNEEIEKLKNEIERLKKELELYGESKVMNDINKTRITFIIFCFLSKFVKKEEILNFFKLPVMIGVLNHHKAKEFIQFFDDKTNEISLDKIYKYVDLNFSKNGIYNFSIYFQVLEQFFKEIANRPD